MSDITLENAQKLATLLNRPVEAINILGTQQYKKKYASGRKEWHYFVPTVGSRNSLKKLAILLQANWPSSPHSDALVDAQKLTDVPWGRLSVFKPDKAVRRGHHMFSRGTIQIGRGKGSNIKLLELSVSGIHCLLKPVNENNSVVGCTIEDRSSNGTWLNKKRMAKMVACPLMSGDIVSLTCPDGPSFVFSLVLNSKSASFFKKYQIGGEIGRGGCASVYKCRVRSSHDVRAVKIIDLNNHCGRGKMALKKDASNEAEIQQELQHPHIIRVFEHFVCRFTVYIVMEYIPGGNLFRQLRVSKYSESDARYIMEQILSVTKWMHKTGITHRDMKPSNILLCRDARVKITDFGCAQRKTNEMTGYTGSPMYFAPEVLRWKSKSNVGSYTCSVDMWSVGVIMFNLMSAHNPPCLQTKKLLQLVINERPWTFISDEAKDLLMKMLEPNPETRITAADALRHSWFRFTSRQHKRRKVSSSGC